MFCCTVYTTSSCTCPCPLRRRRSAPLGVARVERGPASFRPSLPSARPCLRFLPLLPPELSFIRRISLVRREIPTHCLPLLHRFLPALAPAAMLLRVSLQHHFLVPINPTLRSAPNLCISDIAHPSIASEIRSPHFSIRASSSLGATTEFTRASSGQSTNGALLNHFVIEGEQQQQRDSVLARDNANSQNALSPRLGGLDTEAHSYKEKFAIRCYEVGINRTASIETIANLFQEVACNHIHSVGFSTDGFATTPSMRKRGLIWVTTRMHIEVDQYPVWGDVVQVETWCQGEGKSGIRRDWLLMDVIKNKRIGRATSTWVTMNQDTRRLARITDDIREEYEQHCPSAPRYAFPEENSSSSKKIPKLENSQHIRPNLMPRRGDLDMNQHVNNVTYIGWVLESVPEDILDTHQLHRITLDYRRECKHNDAVDSLASLETSYNNNEQECVPNTRQSKTAINGSSVNGVNGFSESLEFLHLLRFAGSEIEINRGRTVWKKKDEKAC